uniref:Desmoglein-1-like n=1 Tax=Acanthochromis polyacanthus TaxID=80966 RepID=A0A3Q1HG81_9TELE
MIIYSLSGPGVDQPPVGQFGVDSHTGYVKIFTTLDREKIPFYTLTGIAKYQDGRKAEKDIELKITVLDENDNPPVIVAQQVGYVEEHSATGTVVMKVLATDADQENTINSKIFYRIKEESNRAGLFVINCHTGEIMVQRDINREVSRFISILHFISYFLMQLILFILSVKACSPELSSQISVTQ